MGQVTDGMVIDAVAKCGTATTSMIYDYMEGQYGLPRPVLSRNAGRKLKQLVKYRIICSMVYEKRDWYYMPGTTPTPVETKPTHCSERIRTHISEMPTGASISIKEAISVGKCSESLARRVLSGYSGLRRDYKANVYYKECL